MVADVTRVTGGLTTAGPNLGPRGRLVIVSGVAALLAVAGHAAGGGALPTSCATLTTVLVLAVVATGAAAWAAQRTRGPWATLIGLAVGQLGTEALLSVPVDDLPASPLTAAVVHALATVALGAMLLGADRSADDTSAVVDLVLPRWWRGQALTAPAEPPSSIPVATAAALRGISSPSPRIPRGPPSLA